jgi:hypothetical protein
MPTPFRLSAYDEQRLRPYLKKVMDAFFSVFSIMDLEAATRFAAEHHQIGVFQNDKDKVFFLVSPYGDFDTGREFEGFKFHCKSVPDNLSKMLLKKFTKSWVRLNSAEVLAMYLRDVDLKKNQQKIEAVIKLAK